MLRWYLASLVFLLVISPAVGFGVYHYVMTHPAEPGTLAGRVYEKTVKAKLSRLCLKNMRPFVKADDTNLEGQLEASCKCFTDDMFEKFRSTRWQGRRRRKTAPRRSSSGAPTSPA
jgi:hypothetical protein